MGLSRRGLLAGIGAAALVVSTPKLLRAAPFAGQPFCDGTRHPLFERYSTLAAAQADYPGATSLHNSADFAYLQSLANLGLQEAPRKGVYFMTNRLNVIGPYSFVGAGAGSTILYWHDDAISAGIEVVQNGTLNHVTLRDFSMITNKQGNNHDNAIRIRNQAGPVPGVVTISDVSITGNSDAMPYKGWGSGVDLYSPNGVVIRGLHFQGASGFDPNDPSQIAALGAVNGFGVRCIGQNTDATSDVVIRDSRITWTYNGVSVGNNVEGVLVDNCILMLVGYGVDAIGTTGPWFHGVRNSHISALSVGIRAHNMGAPTIENNLFFHNAASVHNGTGIELMNCPYATVSKNKFWKEQPGTQTALYTHVVDLVGNTGSVFSENRHHGRDVGYYFANGAEGAVLDNWFGPLCTTPYQNLANAPAIRKRDL